MRFVIGFVLVILILLLLLRLDYSLGRKNHIKKHVTQEYPQRNSDIALFTNGEQLFSDMFTEIENAKDHIHIQFYIFKNDDFSKKFITLLTKKAKQGVEVRLLVDWIGSKSVTKEMEKTLKDAGVSFSYSNTPTFPYFFYKLNARNHRKVTVIDGTTGFIGGFNVGKEYINKDPKFGLWRDYHLKLTGEVVADLQKQFFNDWFVATDEVIAGPGEYYPPLTQGNSNMKLIATNGVNLEDHLVELLKQAKDEIIIGSPYFVPSDRLKNELISAARRNVKIRVLIPKKADHPLVKEAAYPYMDELIKEGIQFFTFTDGFYHAKAIIIDDEICDIGTTNFDKRSLFTNYEINCYVLDKEVVKNVKSVIEKDFTAATEITQDDINQMLKNHPIKIKIATMLSFFL